MNRTLNNNVTTLNFNASSFLPTYVVNSGSSWNSISFANNSFIAFSPANILYTQNAAYSTDGINWISTTIPHTGSLYTNCAYGNGIYVAVDTNGSGAVIYSSDGQNWSSTYISTGVYNFWTNIVFVNGLFYTIDQAGNTATTANATSWSYNTSYINNTYITTFSNIAYGNNVFVTVGTNTINLSAGFISRDGINWSAITLPRAGYWGPVVYGGGYFLVIDVLTLYTAYSLNGTDWYLGANLPSNSNGWTSLGYANGVFMVVANGGNIAAYTTNNGISWNTVSILNQSYTGVVYGNNKLLAVGTTTTVYTKMTTLNKNLNNQTTQIPSFSSIRTVSTNTTSTKILIS